MTTVVVTVVVVTVVVVVASGLHQEIVPLALVVQRPSVQTFVQA